MRNRLRHLLVRAGVLVRAAWAAVTLGIIETLGSARGRRVLALLTLVGCGALLALRPPVRTVDPGFVGVRLNRATGGVSVLAEGPALVLPLLHELRRYPVRDQVYRPARSAQASGESAFQSVEGLSLGVDVTVRYALDVEAIGAMAKRLPENVGRDLIEPLVDGVLHRTLAKHTVRDIFSDKRLAIQDELTAELRGLLHRDGVTLRAIFLGHVDLPGRYKEGLEGLLAEEIATEKMRFTLQLKEKKVEETKLDAEAAKVQREKAAEAAGMEEIIAAKAKAEAMKHVLPLKEKEIEQRRLEAEARKIQRTKDAEGNADARRIEASAEADARRKLYDAEAYRIDITGRAASEQLARDSALIAKNPLLIQKTLADKLSDKIQVVIAPPAAGGFFAANLLGAPAAARAGQAPATKEEVAEAPEQEEASR
jgi:regulator of protease activity HflC (stomatin/prohibitin superfamily)